MTSSPHSEQASELQQEQPRQEVRSISFTPTWEGLCSWEYGIAIFASLGAWLIPMLSLGEPSAPPMVRGLLIVIALSALLITFKETLIVVRAPTLIAAFYSIALLTSQGTEAVRAVAQSSWLCSAITYLLWALATASLSLALAALLAAKMQLFERSTNQLIQQQLDEPERVLLLLVSICPFACSVVAIARASEWSVNWYAPVADLVAFVFFFAISYLVFSLWLFRTVRHEQRVRGNNKWDQIFVAVARNPDQVLAVVSGVFVALLAAVIGFGSIFHFSSDVAPMTFVAAWCGLFAGLLRLIEMLSVRGHRPGSLSWKAWWRQVTRGVNGSAENRQPLKWWLRFGLYPLICILLVIVTAGVLVGDSWLSIDLISVAAALIIMCVALYFISQKVDGHVPGLALIVGIGVIWSALDLNDTYELPYRVIDTKPESARSALKRWLEANEDYKSGEKEPILFLVAAEGGGARAAYMTAVVIEALRETCDSFARADFANIGVSGGSVGLAVSAAAANFAKQRTRGDCSGVASFNPVDKPAAQIAGTDLLGPVVRGLLAGDGPLWFFPSSLLLTRGISTEKTGILQRQKTSYLGDRTEYIERALDRAGMGAADLAWSAETSFMSAGPGRVPGKAPELILLATDVHSGRRVAISHLTFDSVPNTAHTSLVVPDKIKSKTGECLDLPIDKVTSNDLSRLLTVAEIAPGRDPTLLGASLVSARFPVVTPVARLPCSNAVWRLGDGGYYENSGLSTALDLLDQIVMGVSDASPPLVAGQQRKLRVVLIRLENGGADAAPGAGVGMSGIMSPIRTFGGTRAAHANAARARIERLSSIDKQYGPGCKTSTGVCLDFEEVSFGLARCGTEIPLGWSLSEGARADIRKQLGFESKDYETNAECKSLRSSNQQAFKLISDKAKASSPPVVGEFATP